MQNILLDAVGPGWGGRESETERDRETETKRETE